MAELARRQFRDIARVAGLLTALAAWLRATLDAPAAGLPAACCSTCWPDSIRSTCCWRAGAKCWTRRLDVQALRTPCATSATVGWRCRRRPR